MASQDSGIDLCVQTDTGFDHGAPTSDLSNVCQGVPMGTTSCSMYLNILGSLAMECVGRSASGPATPDLVDVLPATNAQIREDRIGMLARGRLPTSSIRRSAARR